MHGFRGLVDDARRMEGCNSLACAEPIDFVPDLPAYGAPEHLLEPSILSGVKAIEGEVDLNRRDRQMATDSSRAYISWERECRHAAFTGLFKLVSSSAPRRKPWPSHGRKTRVMCACGNFG